VSRGDPCPDVARRCRVGRKRIGWRGDHGHHRNGGAHRAGVQRRLRSFDAWCRCLWVAVGDLDDGHPIGEWNAVEPACYGHWLRLHHDDDVRRIERAWNKDVT
jgi:hypothetical protein